MKVKLQINGQEYNPEISDKNLTLLSYLRETLGLTAAKRGCDDGSCGACTVIINGKAKRSCMAKMIDLEGAQITTLESLSTDESIHAIQYSYIKHGAVQCGFCTPGFIMSTKALLDRNNDPDVDEIKRALQPNICRCTGYVKIIEAVEDAASLIKSGKVKVKRDNIYPQISNPFGKSVPRVDAIAKATGELKYADDLFFKNMLHAKVLRSEVPHAEILGIDIKEALRVKGVVKILTSQDIPGKNAFGLIIDDQPVLADKKVRYTGDAVAAVYAETEKAAEEAVLKIRVKYKLLPVLGTMEEALKNNAVLIHNNGKSTNNASHMESGRGDIIAGFKSSDLIFEGEYRTQFIEHAYLEPESGTAVLEKDGRITIYVGSQGPEDDIKQIALALNMKPEDIHIAHMPVGGGFGGKEDISVHIIAALGALKTGRPVKYTYTRRESIRTSGKRNAQILKYKTGVKKDGKITAVKADILADGGAYASAEEAVILRSVSFAAGPYTIENADVKADAVYTNNNPTCAMRGFGNPPVTFAAEVQLNRIAEKLNIDPFDIRLRNILTEGLPTLTGERIKSSVGAKACLLAVKEALGLAEKPKTRPGWKVGIGIASSYKNVGLGIGMEDYGGAYGEVSDDGYLILRVGSVDMGQGSDTAMAQIASETLGWPYSKIVVQSADSDRDPHAGMTTASRQTFVSGNAVKYMAFNLKEKIFNYIRDRYNLKGRELLIKDDAFYEKGSPEPIITLDNFSLRLKKEGIKISNEYRYTAPKTYFSLKEPPGGYDPGKDRLHAAYCFSAQAVMLEVNEKTGRVNVLKVISASDTGRPVNPAAVEGQMEGGVMMGIGYALSEEFKIKNGKIITASYGRLGLQRIKQTPEIQCILVENPHADGPYGAKGMGELPLSAVAPAVVSAIHDALGIWLTSIPVTPNKIIKAIAGK
ncbi:MAG: xanthine dehydrogenase [Spirochaetes bacterium]|nr:MAG: xanthine dehydrogenase [Spirochaetota bacterium]